MKKHKRVLPIISSKKVIVAALCSAIIVVIIYLLVGKENEWTIIFCSVSATLIIAGTFVVLPSFCRYTYSDVYILLSYFGIIYRKIKYSKYDSIFISNAAYNNGYGYGAYGNILMQYTSKGKSGLQKTTYPFITLHKADYPVKRIKSGMSSRELFMIDSQNIFCLGICWFDSLVELLRWSKMPVYVLEDVYLRFEGMFNAIFLQHSDDINRFYIVTNQGVSIVIKKTGDGLRES